MQSIPLNKTQLIAILGLIILAIILLILSIINHNNAFFVSEKKQRNQQESSQIDIIPISVNDPVLGNTTAPITVIGFEDFLCEACRIQNQLINQVLEQYPSQVKFIWKDFSITTVPFSSEIVHVYGYCMNNQRLFASYKEQIFNQIFTTNISTEQLNAIANSLGANMSTLEQCVNSQSPMTHIEKNKLLAQALQIQRAPTFFVNGQQIQTPTSVNEWISVLGVTR